MKTNKMAKAFIESVKQSHKVVKIITVERKTETETIIYYVETYPSIKNPNKTKFVCLTDSNRLF